MRVTIRELARALHGIAFIFVVTVATGTGLITFGAAATSVSGWPVWLRAFTVVDGAAALLYASVAVMRRVHDGRALDQALLREEVRYR